MQADEEFRDREPTEVAVLDALVDRGESGMTVLELRAHVDADIDELESALADLKSDDLVEADEREGRTVIRADERVVPGERAGETEGLIEWVRERVGL